MINKIIQCNGIAFFLERLNGLDKFIINLDVFQNFQDQLVTDGGDQVAIDDKVAGEIKKSLV